MKKHNSCFAISLLYNCTYHRIHCDGLVSPTAPKIMQLKLCVTVTKYPHTNPFIPPIFQLRNKYHLFHQTPVVAYLTFVSLVVKVATRYAKPLIQVYTDESNNMFSHNLL